MITYIYDLHFNVNIPKIYPKITISLLETWNLLLFYIENVLQKNAISNVNNEPLNFFFIPTFTTNSLLLHYLWLMISSSICF